MGWWLFLPYYAHFLGFAVGAILKYGFGVAVEGHGVSHYGLMSDAGLFNTGTRLSFKVGEADLAMPVGYMVNNVAPFLALVLATPGLKALRRLKVASLGTAILVISHVSFIVFAFKMGPSKVGVAIGKFCITLPFILWIVLAYWERLVELLDVVSSSAPEPAAAAEPSAPSEDEPE